MAENIARAMPDNDVDSKLIGIHKIEAAPGDPPVVGEARTALGRIVAAIEQYNADEVRARENGSLSFQGKLEQIRRAATTALAAVSTADGVVTRLRAEVETRSESVRAPALANRAAAESAAGDAPVPAPVREQRAREVRDRLQGVDELRAAQVIRGLIEADRSRSLDAIAAIVEEPLPVLAISEERLDALARRWIEVHDPKRLHGLEAVEAALRVLEAAATRGRRHLARRVEVAEADASRRGGASRRGIRRQVGASEAELVT